MYETHTYVTPIEFLLLTASFEGADSVWIGLYWIILLFAKGEAEQESYSCYSYTSKGSHVQIKFDKDVWE